MGQHGEGARGQAGQHVSLPQVQISSGGLLIDHVSKGAISVGGRELENHLVIGF